MIKVSHLDKTFNKRKKNKIHVLNDISLEFPEKGLMVLLGASGSGKTTLLNVIGGLDRVDNGEIQFYDKHIERYKSGLWDSLRREDIGFIFQNYYLKNDLSVFENVAFVLRLIGIHDEKAIEDRVNYILTQVGMYKYRKKLASQLSGGQQQRVAIARALVKNPKVIIADEPTGNLDSNNTVEIMNIIKNISMNKLVVLVTHEQDLAEFYGDRIIEVKDGKVIKDYQNESQTDHNFVNDNAIYLKDLSKISDLKDKNLEAAFYSDNDEIEPAKVKLIIKNKTLYIDVDTSIQKVKLNDSTLNLQIKDEHFKKKTREEMLETTFDVERLKHDDLHKINKLNVSFKTSLWMAFKKFLRYGRKGKLMLFLFAISGLFIAYSVMNNYTILTETVDNRLTLSKNIVAVDTSMTSPAERNKLIDDIISIEGTEVYFAKLSGNYLSIEVPGKQFSISPDSIEHIAITDAKILYGREPLNKSEVVISYGMYKRTSVGLGEADFTSIGIWDVRQMLGQKITVGNQIKVTIVGIVNENKKTIYTYNHEGLYELTAGNVVNTTWTIKEAYNQLFMGLGNTVYFSSHNPKQAANQLTSEGYDAVRFIDSLEQQLSIDKQRSFLQSISISIVFVALALVVFYFVMRSSMISRIYEIAVNRALGVKKFEIILSFVAEILLIVTVSTFIGFLAMSYILHSVSNTSLASFVVFRVDLVSLFIGTLVVYGLNLIVGVLPLLTLLRKTPSQIISTYDM
ncbi:ATP-binding cassette domain-containing protein [Acholeplasma hippikon]|uniref:ABC transporter ATPase n=1 Tax=Acholeplasma hippikon TaxID=264636 RepID=A0A449BIX7_9MOLU|nr:ATP-binding cassette domain-containing protein [Acholeplasma hippikon]VEU82392.1 ABC transporter ATPase [Acholeplasma hippikon]